MTNKTSLFSRGGLFVLFTLLALCARPQSIIRREYLSSAAALPAMGLMQIQDDRLAELNSGSGVDFRDKTAYGLIRVGFDPDMNQCRTGFTGFRITVEAAGTTISVPGSPVVSSSVYTFTVNYDPLLERVDVENAFVKVDFLRKADFSILEIKAIDRSGNETLVTNPADLPGDLYFEAELIRERYGDFDPYHTGSIPVFLAVSAPETDMYYNEHNVHVFEWRNVDGAVEYELEWAYVDDYSATGLAAVAHPSGLSVVFKDNASSVRVPRAAVNRFFVPAVYERGWVVCRVRAIGKGGPELEDDIFGEWSADDGSLLSYIPATARRYSYMIGGSAVSDFEFNNLNAQYGIQFAEEGKILASGIFADGSLRIRQNVTAIKVEDDLAYGKKSLVSETIYDHMGRAAVNVLPSVTKNGLWYTPNYNLNTDEQKYSYLDFDLYTSAGGCITSAGPMSTSGGASMYYSGNNPGKAQGQQGLVPDAFRYPFTHTVFERNNTGRPKIQGAPGERFQPGSGHETRYVYGSAEQVQLNRLFGTDAGYENYYQKTMMMDPNGQIGITYTDMFGHTVATSLAGKVPKPLEPLTDDLGNPLSDTGEEIEEDMLGKSGSIPHGTSNMLSSDGKSFTFFKTLLIDAEQEYHFSYSTQILEFKDACFPDLCLDCIYELELSLTDECGNYLVGNKSLDGPFRKTLGGTDWDTTCTVPPDSVFADNFNRILAPGAYHVYKKLSINEEAMAFYVEKMIANSTCLANPDDFYEAPDTSGCAITCEDCLAHIGTWEAFFTQAKIDDQFAGDAILAQATLWPVYQAMKSECDGLCTDLTRDYCRASFELLLSDVSRGGQYGEVDSDPSGHSDASAYPLSVFNPTNLLPQKRTDQFNTLLFGSASTLLSTYVNNQVPSWRKPVYLDLSNPAAVALTAGYYDENGNRITVHVEKDENNAYSPQVTDPMKVFVIDAAANNYYTYPENLARLDDFMSSWTPAYAHSLVIYHPEFFQYEWCITHYRYTSTIEGEAVNTFNYDQKLSDMTMAPGSAITFLGAGYTSMTLSGLIHRLTDNDPFFKSSGNPLSAYFYPSFPQTMAQVLENKLTNYQQVDFTGFPVPVPVNFAQSVYLMHHCGYNLGCLSTAVSAPVFGTGGLIQTDADWRALIDFYVSEKQSLMAFHQQMYAVFGETPNTTASWTRSETDCIGNNGFFPFGSFVLNNITTWPANPCGPSSWSMYRNKQRRFGSAMDAVSNSFGLSNPPTAAELQQYASQGYYGETGKCPMASDLEFMLAKLAQDNILTAPADLMNGMLGSNLYNYITQNGTTNPASILYGPAVTGNTLSVTVPQSPCNPFLTLTLPAGKSFGNITFFYGIGDISQVSSDYTFTIRALYLDPSAGITVPETLEVSGTTCIPLTGCEAGFQSVCKPTTQAKDLTRLMSMLSMNGQLNSATPVALNTPMYTPLITPALQVYLGPGGTYTWTRTSSTLFDLTNTLTSRSLHLTVTANTLGTSQTYRFTKIEGPQVTTPVPTSYTQFTFTATEADPTYPLTTPGAVQQTMSGNITVIGTSQTFPVTECNPIRPISCNTQEHKNRDDFETVFRQWIEMSGEGFTPEFITDGCLTDIVYTGPTLTAPFVLVSLEADMSRAEAFGVSHYFIATVKSAVTGETATVDARYCLPLRNCDTCEVTSCNDLGFAVSFPGHFSPQYEARYELKWPCAGFSLTVPYAHASQQAYWADVASQVQAAAIPGVTAYASGGVLYVQVTDPQLLALCPCDDSGNQAGIYLKTNPVALFMPTCCNTGTPPDNGRTSTSEFEPWLPLPQNQDCHPTLLPIPDEPAPYFNPCVEYLLQTAAVNAQFKYNEYLKQKREEYRQMYLQRCMQAMETFDRTYRDGQYHYTLYYYDRAGNLVKTVPPHAVTPLTGSDLAAVDGARSAGTVRVPDHNRTAQAPFLLTTRYRYNSLNGLAEQITPDGGKSRFYYDRLGRVAASQNAKQYAESTNPYVYAYMLYDAQGRVTESGRMANIQAATRTSVYEVSSWNTFFQPSSYTASEVTQTLYDVATPTALGTFVQENLRSRVSSVITQPKDETGFLFGTYYSYDIHGNVKSLVHRNLLVPFTPLQQNRIDYDYDLLSGNVKKVGYNTGRPDRYFHRYAYDDQNRLKEVSTSRNDIQYDLDARYFYYWHGPLSRTELGQNKIQGMDYAYNLLDWVKSLNSDALAEETDPGHDGYAYAGSANTYFGRDAYGYSLHYFDGDYTPIETAYRPGPEIPSGFGAADLWNGNIRAMNHTLKEPDGYAVKPLLQRFTYDQLQRIKSSEAFDAFDRLQNTWDGATPALAVYATSYSYDPAGNLLTLGRAGNDAGTPEMDAFKYKYYPNSNRLRRVNDNVPAGNYGMDVDDQGSGDNYTYDELGNLVYDRAEEIEEITWTLAGKVSEIKRLAGSVKPDLRFYYDATGNRIMKAVIPKDADKKIEYYVHDAQGHPLTIYTYAIENGHDVYRVEEQMLYSHSRIGSWKSGPDLLAYIPEEPPVYRTERGQKRYEMNNHQNNVQTVVSDRKKQICHEDVFSYYEADIRNTYDYYPFGMNMPGRDLEKTMLPCTGDTVYTINETFDSGVGGFVPGNSLVTLSNSAQRLRINTTHPFGGSTAYTYRSFNVTAGKAYEFGFAYDMPCLNIRLGSRGRPNDTTYSTITVIIKDAAGDTVATDTITNSPYGNRILHFTPPANGTYTVEFREDYLGTCAYYLDNVVLRYIDPCVQDSSANDYRYGYQGQEKDDEIKGKGNSLNYIYRMHDPRIGRFFAVDPLTSKYPYYTPYSFSGNMVIHAIELEGLEELVLSVPPKSSKRGSRQRTLYHYSGTTQPNTIMLVFPTGTPGVSTTITRPLTSAEQSLRNPRPSNTRSTYDLTLEDKDNNYIRQTFTRNGGTDGGEVSNPPPLNANTTTTRIDGNFNNVPTSTQTFNIPVAGGATQLVIQYNDGGSFANDFVLTDASTGKVLSPKKAYTATGSVTLSIPSGASNITLTVKGSPNNAWDSFSFSVNSTGPDNAAVNVNAVDTPSQKTSSINVQNNVTSSKKKPINQ